MARYRNIITGAIVNSTSEISGKNWIKEETVQAQTVNEEVNEVVEELQEEREEEQEIPKKEAQTKKTIKKDQTEITKKDIMQELDSLGIKYNPKDTKDKLYKLMIGR